MAIDDVRTRNGAFDGSRKLVVFEVLEAWGLERDGVLDMGPELKSLHDELMRDLKIPPFDE